MENTIYRPVVRGAKGSKSVGIFAPVGSVSMAHTQVRVDAMCAVLDTPSTLLPNGLSIEQMRAFILALAVKAQ